MSSPHNQPVVEDIVSAFKTTQNQSWSMFNDKLGNIPVKDCKKKVLFKSENPIELSDEDISVFGVVPRLEELTLVSCDKCSMIVKRDCIHYHYDRRHSNPNNDFTLQSFIMPNAKTSKHKKQKGNGRKHSVKKIIADENIGPVIQEIKTEFDQEEFERLQEINQTKIKEENEIQYADNECNVNLAITSCSPSTSSGVLNWDIKPCTQGSVHFTDHELNDTTLTEDNNKDFNKLSEVSPTNDAEELESDKLCIAVVKEENNVDCVTSSSKLDNNSQDSKEQTNSLTTINFGEILSDDELVINDESNDVYRNDNRSPSVLQNYREQTKLSSSTYASYFISNKHSNNSTSCKQSLTIPIDFNKETKLNPSIKYSDVTNNKCSTNITIDQSSNTSLNIKEEFKITPSENYSNVVCNKNEGNKSQFLCYQLPSELQSNNERKTFTSNKYKYLNVTSGKSSDGFVANNDYQLTELPKPLEIKITSNPKYLDVIKDSCERKDYSKIEFSKSTFKLLNNETQSQFSPGNKYSYNTVTNNGNLSTLPFNIKEGRQFIQNNKTVTNNENSENTVINFDQSLMTLVDVEEESKPSKIAEYLNDDDCYSDSKYEHCYQLSTEYSNEVLVPLSPSFNYLLSDDEENNVVIDDCKNNYSFPFELRNNEEETKCTSSNSDIISSTSCDNSLNNCDKSTTELLYNDENSKPTLIDYLDTVTDNFENDYYQSSSELPDNEAQPSFSQNPKYPSNIWYSDNCVISYVQSSDASSEIKEDANSLKDTYLGFMSDENPNDSDTSDDHQSTVGLQDIIKETKSTQTNVFLNRMNRKQFIDPITKIDESLGIVEDDESKCTQTDLSLKCCLDCYKMNEDFLDNYIPMNPNVKVVDINAPGSFCAQITTNNSMNSCIPPVIFTAQNAKCPVNNFTPVSSNAQIINNTIISTSAEEYELMDNDDCDHCVSNSSNYLSYSQQFPQSAESQNEHLSNCLTHSPKIITNYHLLKNNDKVYSSESCVDKSKQNENIFHRNIINGSTPHMDKNQVICKDLLKKAVIENVSFVENYNSYSNVGFESKIKKNLKRRVGGQIADDKENHNQWTTGGYKKLKRLEFVVRKRTYSDESDNNDNVDE